MINMWTNYGDPMLYIPWYMYNVIENLTYNVIMIT